VSGRAQGVVGIAHRSALSIEFQTVAILGSSVDAPTPRENAYGSAVSDAGGSSSIDAYAREAAPAPLTTTA
jgi:hypothetical protein